MPDVFHFLVHVDEADLFASQGLGFFHASVGCHLPLEVLRHLPLESLQVVRRLLFVHPLRLVERRDFLRLHVGVDLRRTAAELAIDDHHFEGLLVFVFLFTRSCDEYFQLYLHLLKLLFLL